MSPLHNLTIAASCTQLQDGRAFSAFAELSLKVPVSRCGQKGRWTVHKGMFIPSIPCPTQRRQANTTVHLPNSLHQGGLDTEPRKESKSTQTHNYYIKLSRYERGLRGNMTRGEC